MFNKYCFSMLGENTESESSYWEQSVYGLDFVEGSSEANEHFRASLISRMR